MQEGVTLYICLRQQNLGLPLFWTWFYFGSFWSCTSYSSIMLNMCCKHNMFSYPSLPFDYVDMKTGIVPVWLTLRSEWTVSVIFYSKTRQVSSHYEKVLFKNKSFPTMAHIWWASCHENTSRSHMGTSQRYYRMRLNEL